MLVLIQVLVLNNIHFLGFINPYVYVLFILALPAKTSRWFTLILSFVLGITIDIFSNTLGLHAFACVLVAFLRGPFIKLFTTIEENANFSPSLVTFGAGAYIKYAVSLVFIHHFTLYYMEIFTFTNFWMTGYRALLSSLITISIILGVQLLKSK